jgi:N-acetylglucosamine-6-phosphate deacetylase
VTEPTVLPLFHGTLFDGLITTPTEILTNGWVQAARGEIVGIGTGTPPAPIDANDHPVRADGRLVMPGFVDLHCHGGGGFSFATKSLLDGGRAAEFHRRHGTTSLVASLVSAPQQDLVRWCTTLAQLVHEGEIVGIHLEGPYISRARCGAHNPSHLRLPSIPELEELHAISEHTIVQITIAPELPGALDAIRWMVANKIIAAIGHTNASGDEVKRGVDAGATLATHLCNAMPPMHHRDSSAVFTLLDDDRVVVEVINDEVHLHPTVVQTIFARGGRTRVALITDAIAAAGQGDGTFELGGLAVVVEGGIARLVRPDGEPPGAIAGSSLTMIAAVRNSLRQGASPADVARAASTVPARLLGLSDRGSIEVGKRADLVVF